MTSLTVLVLGCLMLTYSCNGSMEEIVGELQRELQQLKTKTASYESEIQTLKTSYDTKIQELESSAISSVSEILALKQQVKDLKDEQENGTNDLKRRFVLGANSLAEKPAFSAGLSNHATGLGNNQPIVFDNVFTNDLGGYSGLTGAFTAPINGTYFFTATVMSHNGQYLESEICLNGKELVHMYSYDTHYEQGTNSIVLVLKSGDKVWVRHRGTEGSNAHGYNWSAFSGFMI